jgi:hypothetical protein
MSPMSLRLRRSLISAAFLGAAALAGALLPVTSEAVSCPKIIETDHYFDAAKTQYAGSCVRVCNNVWNCTGTRTPYYIVTSQEPCGCF